MSEVMQNSQIDIEEKWIKYWDKEKIYCFDNSEKGGKKKIYSVDTPPPTVSGKMHIGHAFSYSQQDFIVRYKRMKGFNVFYPFGTDDNGLPTERLIEKLKNVKSKNMSRAEFINLCLKTLKEITPDFIYDWKKLGISCDYNLNYSTINDYCRKISQKSFIDLYEKNLIYKKEFPTIWCPECQTAVAQAELEDKEEESLFSTIKFSCGGKDLLIATTRPELLGACVAVFVNPKDLRYKKIIGKKVKVPIFNYEVPIIEDESANIEKGTGVLMICSYGDKFDVDAISKHHLKPKIIFNKDGTLNISNCNGMKIKEARKKILEDLKNKNMIAEQKSIKHIVNVHDKCGIAVEFIATEQWFIKILDKKNKLIEQGRKINWHPEFMLKRYENWIKGLEWDWSISRDRHFGIPIPVWICKKCKEIILASENELPVDPLQTKKKCPKCKSEAQGEEKVLDTWTTSSLTPQISSGLIKENIKIPFSLRPQGHDIIRTWAFYTIVKSLYHENKIPWKDIIVSGFVTLTGEKMSKSKGNVVAPQEVMSKFGADGLRFWAAGSRLGEDIDYQEKEFVIGKKFITKLDNASKFVFMNLGNYSGKKPKKLMEVDKLFINELNKIIKQSVTDFDNYEYHKVKSAIDNFFWSKFCDNYLEIVKKRVYKGTLDEKESAFYGLYQMLFAITKMFAPFTPFVTEEVYQNHFKQHEKVKSIHICEWPNEFKIEKTKNDEEVFNLLIETIAKIRGEKSIAKRAMNSEIILTLEKETQKKLKDVLKDLKDVVNASEIKEGKFGVGFK